MPYVSELINRPVVDVDGESVGVLDDVLATQHSRVMHPQVVAIVVKQGGRQRFLAFSNVLVLFAPAIALNKKNHELEPYNRSDNDIYLVRDVLDKQILDTNGVRVVRVNDVELTRVNGDVYVANVDISGAGLLRRMGFRRIARSYARRATAGEKSPGIISWDDIELLATDQPIRLKVTADKITELHPADLVDIISDLPRAESNMLLDSLDIKTLADTLEEAEPDFQASLIEQMSDERAVDVLEEMAPDEAADLLAELPKDRSNELLNLMEIDEAEDVRKLLTYEEDTAGGIMNTEFLVVHPEITAEETMAMLRRMADEAETIYYIYVVDDDERLTGVFSLRDLVLAQPSTPVAVFMEDRVITVALDEDQEHCAQVISKYNLLAVPVVDADHHIHGIVTADDALDKIIPTAWKKRLPRLYR